MPSKKEIQDTYSIAQAKTDKWKKIHESLATTKDHLPTSVVMAVEEIIINQVKFVTDMQRLNNMLVILRAHVTEHGDGEKKMQLAILNNYLTKLDGLLESYAALPDPLASINDQGMGATPEELIEQLCTKLNRPELKKLMSQLGDLADDQMKINDIYRTYQQDLLKLTTYNQERTSDIMLNNKGWSTQQRQIPDFTIMPVQNLPRIYMPIEELQNKLASFQSKEPDYHLAANEKPTKSNPALQRLIKLADTGVANAKNNVHEYNNKIKAAQIAEEEFNDFPAEMKITQKQTGMLRNILSININTPLQKENQATTTFFAEYLKTALAKTYPQIFNLNIQGGIDVTLPSNNSNYANIHKALGYDLQKLSLTGAATLAIDPAKFDAQTLDNLYQKDPNPLWLVLKSTKPISSNFTAEQKIQAYVELAHAFKDKKIGATGKYLAAYNLAQAALAVAQEHPEQNTKFTAEFGPESTLGKWIIGKTKTKDDKNLVKNNLTFSLVKREADYDETPSFISTTTTHSALSSSQSAHSDSDVFASDEETSNEEYDEDNEHAVQQQKTIISDAIPLPESQTQSPAIPHVEPPHNPAITRTNFKAAIASIKENNEHVKKQMPDEPKPIMDTQKIMRGKQSYLLTQGLNKLSVNTEELNKLKEQIHKAETPEELQPLEDKVLAIIKISQAVNTVTEGLRRRKDFFKDIFSSSSEKKADEISSAFAKLTLDEKAELGKYSEQTIQEKLDKKENTNIGKFLETINLNRAYLFQKNETTSFKHFKEQFKEIKTIKEEADVASEQRNHGTKL